MEIRHSAYYSQFRCIAAACPDSCCHGWAVQVDEASAQRYRSLPGGLGDDLRTFLSEEDGDVILSLRENGRCPMWREDGLCRIQAELGEEALCNTCRQFPRLRHDYGDFVELGLELSCPEAARLILASGESQWHTETVSGGEPPEYDREAMAILLRSREEILRFLACREWPVGQALSIMLLYGYDVQNELDGGERTELSPERLAARAVSLALPGDMEQILGFYKNLEILTPQWKRRLTATEKGFWREEIRALARYFVERYWLQAVSDYDLACRVKFMAISCLVVKALGGDILETAQLYSKEIENDADNVEALLDGAYTAPAFADRGLLGLLIG